MPVACFENTLKFVPVAVTVAPRGAADPEANPDAAMPGTEPGCSGASVRFIALSPVGLLASSCKPISRPRGGRSYARHVTQCYECSNATCYT